MSDTLSKRRHVALFCAILLLAVVLRWLAFSLFASVHLDEVLQYQERAFRMVFGRGLVPWETRYGLRNALIPDLLAAPMWLASRVTSEFWTPPIAARTVFAAVCLAVVPAAYSLGGLRSRAHALVAMFVAAIWYESVLFGVQVLSESIATAFACCGAAAVLRARESRGAALLAGFLLAMTVLLRLQYGAFVGVLAIAALGRDVAAWRRLVIGTLPALALGALTDLAAGQAPFAWALTSLGVNLGQGKAASFGVSPPWAYVQAMLGRMSPLAPLIVIGAVLSGARYRPLLLAALANVVVHSLIGHKEYRFIWLSVLVLVILAAIASVDLVLRLVARRGSARSAALAGLCAAWAGLSLIAYQSSGQLPGFRDEGALRMLALDATRIPGSCAVAAPIRDRKALNYVFMPRPLMLYLYPDAMNDSAVPFDHTITDAADTLIVTGRARPHPPYRAMSCRTGRDGQACLYWRPGGCRNAVAAEGYEYQTMLVRNDQ